MSIFLPFPQCPYFSSNFIPFWELPIEHIPLFLPLWAPSAQKHGPAEARLQI